MYGTQDASHIWQHDSVNLICGELGGFRRGKHSASLFHNPNQDVRMAVHGDDFVLDLAETAKHLAQRMSEPREFGFVPLGRAARYLVGKPEAALRYRRQKHEHKIGNHTVKSGSTLQSLTALSVGEAEFYVVVKGGQVIPEIFVPGSGNSNED